MLIFYRNFFNILYPGEPFKIFSKSHVMALILIFISILVVILMLRKYKNHIKLNYYFRIIISILLLTQELLFQIWHLKIKLWSIKHSLPLNLCSVVLLLSAILILTKNKKIFNMVYYIGTASVFFALLFPYNLVGYYEFPHFRFFHFFLSHSLVLFVILYMIFVENYIPTFWYMLKTYLICFLYSLFIFMINIEIKANYLFLGDFSFNKRILNVISDWPLYLFELYFKIFFIFFILYVPFKFLNYKNKRSECHTNGSIAGDPG
ncbi:MAG: hypothetical protein A2015_07630 [Spirochaetes bacterium GWF1_31_7]|nr:MAG: hypothetical protein A2Y30_01725 [Spirochaetes bacterium GWE1_32_154]OHD46913.1 MAG: hypothetical protein A2015_07630 [Spirochaetes bacterium GWF1_31_7]OHD48689.1 MAG: hypothetical protein A2Y29_13860 [Spirochaetes bacterium GWE2_31_10]HBD94918.1 TIGR02206 family membrane protein [Spirochaetia bacterium]HBI36907.1 TIGR02206 family membrane protein [Spirochaetia bacterium]